MTEAEASLPDVPKPSRSTSHRALPEPKYVRTQTLGLHRSGSRQGNLSHIPYASRAKLSKDTMDTTAEHGPPDQAAARTAVAFPRTVSMNVLDDKEVPQAHKLPRRLIRSDSLPVFPSPSGSANLQTAYEYGEAKTLSDLSTNPKEWKPSELAIFLAHVLSLTPRALVNDVMRFVVQDRITGKRFMKMTDKDLVDMGMNIAWCRILSKARERLRAECLKARIFGSNDASGASSPAEPSETDLMSLLLKPSNNPENEDWKKNSWRRTEGKNSKGRVMGIAKVFENQDDEEVVGRTRSISVTEELEAIVRVRRSSITGGSTDEIDYKNMEISVTSFDGETDGGADRGKSVSSSEPAGDVHAIDWGLVEPITMEEAKEDAPNIASVNGASEYAAVLGTMVPDFGSAPLDYESRSNLHAPGYSAGTESTIGRSRNSRKDGLSLDTLEQEVAPTAFAENDGNIITIKKQGSLRRPNSAEDFGSIKVKKVLSEGNRPTGLQNLFRDVREDREAEEEKLALQNRDGTMIAISRKSFEEMQKRLAAMEAELEPVKSQTAISQTARSPTGLQWTSPVIEAPQGLFQDDQSRSQAVSEWVRTALGEANGLAHDRSWIGLGGWALAAGLGIGIVCGEAVLSKLRR